MALEYLNVRDLVGAYQGASDVFRRHGIDYYRIGGLTLTEAAERQQVGLDRIIDELSKLPPNPSPLPTSTLGLMTYIDSRYYAVHRKQLRMVVRLARLIAANRACSGQVPPALPGGLQRLAETLELHQNREEGSLFSAMMTGPADRLKFPVIHAIREHDEISDQLDTIAKLTGNYLTPPRAGRSIQRLYDICGALDGELRLHMHIENNLLFPPFLGDQAGITGWPSNASD